MRIKMKQTVYFLTVMAGLGCGNGGNAPIAPDAAPRVKDNGDICNMANIPKQVNFNPSVGEGLVSDDLIKLQRFAAIARDDSVLSSLARLNEADFAGLSTSHAYAIGIGGAVFAATGVNDTTRNCPGIIMQRVNSAAPNGSDQRVLIYHVDLDEMQFAIPAASAGNERRDIITTQLVEVTTDDQIRSQKDATTGQNTQTLPPGIPKELNVIATTDGTTPGFLRTAGVEAASDPAEPATPAGHIKLYSVLVDDNAEELNPQRLRDYRIPLGLSKDVYASGTAWGHEETQWSVDPEKIVASSGATKEARIVSSAHAGQRLLKVGVGVKIENVSPFMTVHVGRSNLADNTNVSIVDLSSEFTPGAAHFFKFIDLLSEPPIWGNGYSAGIAVAIADASLTGSATGPQQASIFVDSTQSNDEASGVFFLYAGQ